MKLDAEVAQTAIKNFYLLKIQVPFHWRHDVTTKQIGHACGRALFCKESCDEIREVGIIRKKLVN